MLLLLLASCGSVSLSPAQAAEATLPQAVVHLLESPDAALVVVPPGHRVVALSLVAESCAAMGQADCAQRAAELAVDRAPQGMLVRGMSLYATHMLIALSASESAGQPVHTELADRVAEHLSTASLAEPTSILPSFGGPERWPADQAAVLHALWLHDQARGTSLHEAPAAAWLAHMDTRGSDPVLGLHRSELTGTAPHGELPRGCALSWTVYYAASFAPQASKTLWSRYKAAFLVEFDQAAGLREWAPGVDLPADMDSGPIVAGVGASATALGIMAARAVGDGPTADRLAAAEALGRMVAGDDPQAQTVLAEAILLRGQTARP